MNSEMITPLLVALIGAGGLWQLLQLKAKNTHEAMMQDRDHRNEFNDTLKAQVDRLASQVNQMVSEKEDLLKVIGDLKADLAATSAALSAAEATIKSLQEAMMRK